MIPWQGGYKYFTEAEMLCKCGCGTLPAHEFMVTLEATRHEFGFPMIISSGARCAWHNAAVSDSGTNGPHVQLVAADVLIYGSRAFGLIQVAIENGFTGIGVKQDGHLSKRFLHFDTIKPGTPGFNRPWLWSY